MTGLLQWLSGKESTSNAGASGGPWVHSLHGEYPLEKEMANLLQYSCLENPMDRGAWRATVHGVTRVGHNLATKPPPESLRGLSKVTNV